MDKLRNLVNPGKTTDDEIMYGSGTSPDPVHSGQGVTGEGTHLESANRTFGTDPAQQSSAAGTLTGRSGNTANTTTTTTTSTTGPTTSSGTDAGPVHSSNLMNKLDPRVGSKAAQGQSAAYGTEGGNFTTGTGSYGGESNPYSAKGVDPRIGGNTTNMPGSFPADSNAYDSRMGATNTGGGYPAGTTAAGANTATSNTGTTGGREFPLSRDAAAVGGAAAVGEGVHHHNQRERDREMLDSTGPASGAYDGATGSHRLGNTDHRYGHDTSTTGPAAVAAEGRHHHHEPATQTSAYDTTSGAYGSQGNQGVSGNTDHRYGRDAAAVGAAATAGEGIHHHRQNEREREGLGNTANTGYAGTTATGANQHYFGAPSGTAVSGPHTTATANRLDPGVNQSGGQVENAKVHHPHHGGGAESADKHHGLGGGHAGRDTAAAGAGAGVAEDENKKHGLFGFGKKRDSDAAAETTTSTTGQGSGHHVGRDAAMVGAGAGVAEHEHHRHNTAANQGLGTTGQPATGPTTTGLGASGPTHQESGHHHIGRDAAVGGAGVGLAEHEHHRHQNQATREPIASSATATGPATSGTTGTTGASSQQSGHHLGRDAAVASAGAGIAEHEHHRHQGQGARETLGSDPTTRVGTATTGTTGATGASGQQTGHHLGRDAAVGGAGVGLAEHEHHKHGTHKFPDTSFPASVTGVSDTSGVDPATGNHHIGRDAAVAGAGAGLAEHEHRKHTAGTHGTAVGTGIGNRDAQAGAALTGPAGYEAEKGHAARAQQAQTGAGYNESVTAHDKKDHHYGRDAAGAGTAGVGAYEVDKHHHNDKEVKREQKAEEKEAKREAKEEKKHSGGGLLGFLHRDKHSKEEKEEVRHHEHDKHTGRDAAIGTAAGAGAYEAEKHHHQHSTAGAETDVNKPLPAAPGNRGVGTGEGTQNALADRTRGPGAVTGNETSAASSTGNQSHFGRDAAAVGGAATLGEHEHHKHQPGDVPEADLPAGTTLGDKLHGVERNRGINTGESAGVYGDSAGGNGAGAGVPGTARQMDTYGGTAGSTGPTATGPTQTGQDYQHHVARDSGVGITDHEHHKRRTSTTPIYDQMTSSSNDYNAPPSHYGTSAGTAGAMATEGRHHHPGVTYNDDGLNKLHKNPPASHPAAQGGVTDEGRVIEPGTGRTVDSGY